MAYSGVYWDNKLPTMTVQSKFDIKWNGDKVAVRGQNIIIQTPPNHFSLNVRCQTTSGVKFITRLSDFHIDDKSFVLKIKENRLTLIKKGLLKRIEEFDLNDDEDFKLPI